MHQNSTNDYYFLAATYHAAGYFAENGTADESQFGTDLHFTSRGRYTWQR